MKKKAMRKLALSRETLQLLDSGNLKEAGGGISIRCSGQDTCSVDYCPTLSCGRTCPTACNPTACM